MSRAHVPPRKTEARYYEAAQEYLRDLREHRPEHFMEATQSATQREITVASFAQVRTQRPDVQIFNELLVQYHGTDNNILRVVPDNMVVVHPEPLGEMLSFNLPTQVARPFWMFEYVSTDSRRKDYEESFEISERALRVPYYLIFYPETQDLSLYRLNTRRRYSSVKPGRNHRHPVPDLNMEVAILDGWVRYWYDGELLPLTADLVRGLNQAEARLTNAEARITDLEAENARLRALLARQSGTGGAEIS